MTWEEIKEKLDKEFEGYESLPTNENERFKAQVWYWRGITAYTRLMAEEKGGEQ